MVMASLLEHQQFGAYTVMRECPLHIQRPAAHLIEILVVDQGNKVRIGNGRGYHVQWSENSGHYWSDRCRAMVYILYHALKGSHGQPARKWFFPSEGLTRPTRMRTYLYVMIIRIRATFRPDQRGRKGSEFVARNNLLHDACDLQVHCNTDF